MEDNKEDNIYDYGEESVEYVMGYSEGIQRARGGAQVMGSEIEGKGLLAKFQERQDRRQAGTQLDRKFLADLSELKRFYSNFGVDDEVFLKNKFTSLHLHEYKNSTTFLLAVIALREGEGKLSKEGLKVAFNLASDINQLSITNEDVIRYCRLILATE